MHPALFLCLFFLEHKELLSEKIQAGEKDASHNHGQIVLDCVKHCTGNPSYGGTCKSIGYKIAQGNTYNEF